MRKHASRRRWAFEVLEDRTAPAVLTVNGAADDTASDGILSLREAVALVNATGDANAALGRDLSTGEAAQIAGAFGANDTIRFAAGITTVTLTSELVFSGQGAVTIQGGGVTLTRDASAGSHRLVNVQMPANVTLDALTLTNGHAERGGAIYNDGGWVVVTNATFSGNSADFGGAIFNNLGVLTVTNATLSGNSANAGGAIYSNNRELVAFFEGPERSVNDFTRTELSVTNATLSGNSAEFGGAIYNNRAELTVTASTLSDNSATDGGGAIYNRYGHVTVTTSTLSENSANFGGAIYNQSGMLIVDPRIPIPANWPPMPELVVKNSTFSGNSAILDGGAIFNRGLARVTNSTLSGNSANDGGGISNDWHLDVTNSTIVGNRANADGVGGGSGGGIRTAGSDVLRTTLKNTIVAGNLVGTGTTADDLDGNVSEYSFSNVIGSATSAGGLTHGTNGNLVGNDGTGTRPLASILDPILANNGGPTKTHALVTDSVAINAGRDASAWGVNTDQRGAARISGLAVDIGSYERQFLEGPFVVSNAGDGVDGNYEFGQLTLREAVLLAEGHVGPDTISFAAGITTVTLTSELVFSAYGALTIQGGGVTLTRNASAASHRLVHVQAIANVTLDALTLTNGHAEFGGAIYNDGGWVVVTNSTFSGNSADFGGAICNRGLLSVTNSTFSGNSANVDGGAICNNPDVTSPGLSAIDPMLTATSLRETALFVTNSTLSGNTANAGGAIYNVGTLTVTNSTLSGNSANDAGGGISNDAYLTLINSTIVGNRADADGDGDGSGGGVRTTGSGKTTLKNTIVAGNLVGTGTTGDDLAGNVDALSANNLIGSATSAGGLTHGINGNLVGNGGTGTRPLASILDPILADNGGPTKTHALVTDSVAINAGINAFVNAPTDQRGPGFPRMRGPVDIGAVEFQSGPIAVPVPTGQVVGRDANGAWWYTLSNRGQINTVAGPVWSTEVTWVDVASVDLTGDGLHELVGRVQESGEWWVSSPNAAGVFTTTKWDTWNPTVTWVDARFSDFDADGLVDLVARVKESGEWWVGKSTGSRFAAQFWDTWSATVTWVDVDVVDLNRDGRGDILARVKETGEWWVTTSNGSTKGATTKWASWNPSVTWVDVKTGDLNGDFRLDIIGRVKESGEWWAGMSTGASFTTAKWTAWSTAVTWVDVRLADLDGDGRADLIGRVLETADWWVTQTTTGPATASAGTTSKWADWSESVVWKDVVVADFNGDGKLDLAARELSGGDWWVNVTNTTGTGFVVSLFADWATVPWFDIQATRLRP